MPAVVVGLTDVLETLPLEIVDLVLFVLDNAAVDLVLPEPFAASDLTLVIEVEGILEPLVKSLPFL